MLVAEGRDQQAGAFVLPQQVRRDGGATHWRFGGLGGFGGLAALPGEGIVEVFADARRRPAQRVVCQVGIALGDRQIAVTAALSVHRASAHPRGGTPRFHGAGMADARRWWPRHL